VLLWFYLHHWSRPEDATQYSPQTPAVSVLIAARNEADHIVGCLESVLAQDYPGHVECILIDDHSEDDTVRRARAMFGDRIRILQLDGAGKGGKKKALATGIAEAEGEIIMTTDADCVVPQRWVRKMVSAFTERVRIVTGPVAYTSPHNIFELFQAMDVAALLIITAAGIRSRMHHIANGANLAFRKSAFEEVGGYTGHMHLASGDDLFLIQKIAREHPGGIRFLKSSKAIVSTSAERTWRGFIRQRIRWASKNQDLPERAISHIWMFVWLAHFLLLTGIVAGIFYPLWLPVMGGCLIVKMVIDGRLVYAGLQFAGMQKFIWYYPAVFVLHYVYVLLMGWFAVVGKGVVWKGRRVGYKTAFKRKSRDLPDRAAESGDSAG
jgi:cellulose synthase/poly-beta-1,6-N-acetylglucosamine synthase-like glycosyltransferase